MALRSGLTTNPSTAMHKEEHWERLASVWLSGKDHIKMEWSRFIASILDVLDALDKK